MSQVDASNLLGVTNWVGRRFGLHASVSGKLAYARLTDDVREALLREQRFDRYTERTIVDPQRLRAELALISQRGYACSVDELEIGLSMIGVDVPSAAGRGAVASIGIMGPTSRVMPAIDDTLATLQHAAARLSTTEG